MSKSLNIITLNIPYPPDYGGMIDTFYRIKALHDLGIQIHLHCFEYGRTHSTELESLCSSVNYYPRKSGLFQHFSIIPYIVKTRRSKRLLDYLIKNGYPILFDGLHTTFYLNHSKLREHKKLIRLHNIEHNYYRSLARYENNIIRKLYYIIESFKLKHYERVVSLADSILPISTKDQNYFESRYHTASLLAPFHPFEEMICKPGMGKYILYHGDLSISENIVVVENLISNVFSLTPFQCIIAGKNPSTNILQLASQYSNIKIVSNPDNQEMEELISDAQIQLLPSLESNGFKIKLLIALHGGRHCLINTVTAGDSVLGNLCEIADSNQEIIAQIDSLMELEFTNEMIKNRKKILSKIFSNISNGKDLITKTFSK